MEGTYSSETSVLTTLKLRHDTEDGIFHKHSRENFKSSMKFYIIWDAIQCDRMEANTLLYLGKQDCLWRLALQKLSAFVEDVANTAGLID
jgi:hypothetical protein